MRRTLTTIVVVTMVVLAGCASGGGGGAGDGGDGGGFSAGGSDGGDGGGFGGDGGDGGNVGGADGGSAQATDSGNVGYSVGGAQDAHVFRKNIREGYVPQPTDVTYEGLFHDYYFDTGQNEPCDALFCPSYSRAVSLDPISKEKERFVTVGLNSGLSKADFQRKNLNLVVVVDTSGSMGESFDRYYYDGGEKKEVESAQTKMAAAADAVSTLTTHLDDNDRIGVVAYDNDARVVQQLQQTKQLDMEGLRNRIRGMRADGGTNLDAGMQTAQSMLRPFRNADQRQYETRVIYVTDAMPNTGETGASSLHARLERQARAGVHSTFVGVGVDFNSNFVESVSSVRGANYYTVDSPSQFEERMDEGFDYMVTPLVYNLSLSVQGSGYEIENVYGTTSEGESTARLMHVKTLFPSRTEGGKTKGGVVLLELERTGPNPQLTMRASYENRAGESHEQTRTITFEDRSAPYFESSGVRKAVVLHEYGALMRNWAAYERAQVSGGDAPVDSVDAPVEHRPVGKWEQQSVSLQVSPLFQQRIERFEGWFDAHRRALGEDALAKDARMLDVLTVNGTQSNVGVATG